MAVFTYTALKPDGSIAKGELTANDRSEAMRRLDRSGLQPVSLNLKSDNGPEAKKTPEAKSAAPTPTSEKVTQRPKNGFSLAAKETTAANKNGVTTPTGPVKMKRKEIINFTEELSDLLSAGLQLEPALKIMEAREEKSAIKDVATVLRQKVRDGASFSSALRSSSKDFGDLYCSLATAGEISGALPVILRRQGEYLKAIGELQSRVVTALIYPAFLIVAGVLVTIMFVTFLIPQLVLLLKKSGKELPMAAQILLGIGDFFKGYWWAVLLFVVQCIWLYQTITTHPVYRPKWDRIKLTLPLVGDIFAGRFYVQLLETLANLVDNGLPLLRALELSRDAAQNLFLRGLLDKVIGIVGEGGSLSKAFKRVGFFPSLMIDMLSVGEQTGDLPLALRRTADRYDKELQKKIERIQAMVPHVVTVIMAILVGLVAVTMIRTIFDSISGMKQG